MSDWTDAIVGDRMAVDNEFTQRVQASRFTSQQWGLIMTAVEFEIEHADDPERARIVADTEKLPQIVPELDNIGRQTRGMPGAPGADDGGNGGVLDTLKSALGLDGSGTEGDHDEQLAAAERLTQEYAEALQEHLEGKGKFEQVRVAYQE